MYTVVKCGASGHNIRSNPNLMAPPIGMLALSDQVSVIRTKEVKYCAILWLKFVIVTPKGQLILECPFLLSSKLPKI